MTIYKIFAIIGQNKELRVTVNRSTKQKASSNRSLLLQQHQDWFEKRGFKFIESEGGFYQHPESGINIRVSTILEAGSFMGEQFVPQLLDKLSVLHNSVMGALVGSQDDLEGLSAFQKEKRQLQVAAKLHYEASKALEEELDDAYTKIGEFQADLRRVVGFVAMVAESPHTCGRVGEEFCAVCVADQQLRQGFEGWDPMKQWEVENQQLREALEAIKKITTCQKSMLIAAKALKR